MAKVIQIMSKFLRARAGMELSFYAESRLCGHTHCWWGACVLLLMSRGFLFSLKSAPEISLLSHSCVRMGAVLMRG